MPLMAMAFIFLLVDAAACARSFCAGAFVRVCVRCSFTTAAAAARRRLLLGGLSCRFFVRVCVRATSRSASSMRPYFCAACWRGAVRCACVFVCVRVCVCVCLKEMWLNVVARVSIRTALFAVSSQVLCVRACVCGCAVFVFVQE